jgi:Domain of unknown function (DUF4920)
MKKTLFVVVFVCFTIVTNAQSPKEANKGVVYGAGTTPENSISVNELDKKLQDNKYTGKITGKVKEVCQEKGCWMKIEKDNGETVMVKFKDYAYFMPKNIVGKNVVLDGEATVKEISVKQQRHYAEDAGKSKEEIAKITQPKKEMIFVAKGVLVL